MPEVKSAFKIMDHKKFNEGLIYDTKTSGPLQIIEYRNKFNVKVRFLNTGFETIANIDNIRKGYVKDPYAITQIGGYFGEGNFVANQDMKIYKVWEDLLRRAYMHEEKFVNYKNCSVCEEWLNFQTFANWYSNYRAQLNPECYQDLQIDKDILQWGNIYKIYSPSTCCLIPGRLNSIISSCLDKSYILNEALICLNNNSITKEIYDAICMLEIPQPKYLNAPYQFDKSIIDNRLPEQNVNIDPSIVYETPKHFTNKEKYEGKIFETKNFGPLVVEEYFNSHRARIRFLNTNNVKIVDFSHMLEGKVKDDLAEKVRGKGFLGSGKYDSKNSLKAYSVWGHMLDSKSKDPIDPIWLNFQNFAEWYESNLSLINPVYHDKMNLNKSLLQWGKSETIYSPNGCCLIPDKLNVFLASFIPRKGRNLPSGIYYKNNRYIIDIRGLDGKKISKTVYSLEEALDFRLEIKKDILIKLSNFYLSENAITKELYDILINLDLSLY